jgi:hypothetical protein
MNFFQNIGLLGMASGAVLYAIDFYHDQLPHWNVAGGTIVIDRPPAGLPMILFVAGIVLIIAGTAWKMYRDRAEGVSREDDEDDDED